DPTLLGQRLHKVGGVVLTLVLETATAARRVGRVIDNVKVPECRNSLGKVTGVVAHGLLNPRVAITAEADEVVGRRQNHGAAAREVEAERLLDKPQDVGLGDKALGNVADVAPQRPADPRIHQAKFVAGDVDGLHLLEAKVPFQFRIQKGGDEGTTRTVNVQWNIQPFLVLDCDQCVIELLNRVILERVRRSQDADDADGVFIDSLEYLLRRNGEAVRVQGDQALFDLEIIGTLV